MAVASAHVDGVPASRKKLCCSCLEDAVVNQGISNYGAIFRCEDGGRLWVLICKKSKRWLRKSAHKWRRPRLSCWLSIAASKSATSPSCVPMRASPGVYFRVVKNTLARRAVQGTPFEALADKMVGPLVYGISADPVAAAKVVHDFAKSNDKLVITARCLQRQGAGQGGRFRIGHRTAARKCCWRNCCGRVAIADLRFGARTRRSGREKGRINCYRLIYFHYLIQEEQHGIR